MEFVFVSHGQAEHELGEIVNLEMESPGLTPFGIEQAERLKLALPLTEQDAVIVSPTKRTLQTAQIWCEGTEALRFVHPSVGPRQYPLRYDFQTPRCDLPLDPGHMAEHFSQFLLAPEVPDYVWLQGIHTLPELLFAKWSSGLLAWCRSLERNKVYIVSHDGTIANYLLRWNGTHWSRDSSRTDLSWIPMSV